MNKDNPVLFAVVLTLLSAQASSSDDSVRVESDGAIHVRELVIPPSELWSPEYRKYYLDQLANPGEPAPTLPARDAPRSEWDKFDAADKRKNIELVAKAKQRYAVDVQDTRIAGIPAAIVNPKGGVAARNKRRVLLNLHGGGFVVSRGTYFGQAESIPVAAIGGFKVITLDYRQAPFHTYPATTEDVEAVYRELLKSYKPSAIGQSREAREKIRPAWDATDWYMSTADANDPRAYPGSFDAVLAQFPPTLLLVGTREIFMSPTIVAHARMLKLGVDASLYVMEGAPHAAHVVAVGTPEAHDANAAIARFFDKQLAR